MSRGDNVLKATALTWMTLVGLVGGSFVVSETLDDPGGWSALALLASWLVPLVALAALAVLRPATAEPVFVVATLLVAVFTLADASFDIIARDDWGPVAPIVVFALGVAAAFLGLHRPATAGILLVVAGLAQFGAALLMRSDGNGPRFVVGGSSGAVILPLIVGGVLFLLAGLHTSTPDDGPRQRASASALRGPRDK